MVVKLVLFACYFAASAAAVCDGDCEASPAAHGAALLQAKARAGAEHEQKVLLMMSQNPKATKEACDACVTAQEVLVTPQKAFATAIDDLAIAAHAFVSASKNHVACSAADCEATLAAKAEAEELIATGDAAVVAATRAVSDADTAAHAACDAVRDGTAASIANNPFTNAVPVVQKVIDNIMPKADVSPATNNDCGATFTNLENKKKICDSRLQNITTLADFTTSICDNMGAVRYNEKGKKMSKRQKRKLCEETRAELVKKSLGVDEVQ